MSTFLLIAPDNAFAEYLAHLLRELFPHSRVLAAPDPERALQHARGDLPDVLLLQAPPDRDRFVALGRVLRGEAFLRAVPLLVLASADPGYSLPPAIREAGADDYLPAPLDPDLLVFRIHLARRLAAAERDLHRLGDQAPSGVLDAGGLAGAWAGFGAIFTNMPSPSAFVEALEDAGGQVVGGRFLCVNPAFARLVGRDQAALAGRLLNEVIPDTWVQWLALLGESVQTGKMLALEQYFGEFGGHFRAVAFSPRQKIVVLTLLDTSSRVLAEERARDLRDETIRAEYWEWIASLAGGFAHKLNNILGPILCYADYLLHKLPPTSDARGEVVTIKESSERAIAIVEDLHILGKGGLFKPGPVQLNDVIRAHLEGSALADLRRTRPGLRLETALDARLPLIRGFAPHLARIVAVLFDNACAAAGPDGRVALATAVEDLDRTLKARPESIRPGHYAVLRLADSGAPLDPEEVEKIFEPFYKLQRVGHRESNLGMALLRRIVKTHDGYIRIGLADSGLTEFALYFPAVAGGGPAAELPQPCFQGEVSVLVVDDMKTQRDVARQILTSLGCRVFLASTGREAVAMVRERLANQSADRRRSDRPVAYDVILLDMLLEDDFDGLDTYKAIREFCPEQPCLVVSGFAKSERVTEAEQLGIREFIRKPYTWDVLRDALRRALV